MTIPTRSFSYIPNTLAQSSQVNTNENTLYAWANGGIDDTNLNHLVGIFASTITANSTATSKFGTNPASTVGFQFIAPAANLTPLSVCGVTSQSVNIFEVDLTSGGTKALFVTATGALQFGNLSGSALPNAAAISGGGSGALLLNTTSGQPITFGAGSTGSTTLLSILSTGAIQFANAGGGALPNTASTTGGSSGALLLNTATGQNIQFSAGSGAGTALSNINSSTGNYTATSDARLKENVADLDLGLDALLTLRPVSFDWISTKETGQGFIAQEVQTVVPRAVSNITEDILGVTDAMLTPVIVKAIQQLSAKFEAYAAAH